MAGLFLEECHDVSAVTIAVVGCDLRRDSSNVFVALTIKGARGVSEAALRDGPGLARVDGVDTDWSDAVEGYEGFEARS